MSYLALCACDGAGSALHGGLGARLAIDAFRQVIEGLRIGGHDQLKDARHLFSCVRERFLENIDFNCKVHGRSAQISDFACTFLGVVVSNSHVVFLQIGDGAVVFEDANEPGTYSYFEWPMQGEYESTTYFLTQNIAVEKAHCQVLSDLTVNSIALFTDGIQRLALDYASRSVVSGFFRPLLASLSKLPPGLSTSFKLGLEQFLDSERVNERTDDDKTLVLAARLLQPTRISTA